MRNRKRMVSVILAAVMIAGAVTGCKTGRKNADPSAETPSGEPVAMGRYKEVEISLPEEIGDNLYFTAFRGADKKLELYTASYTEEDVIGKVYRHVYENGAWVKDESWWGYSLLEREELLFNCVYYGMDGRYYLSGMDSNYIFHLYQIGEDGSATEMIENAFKPEAGREYGLIPRTVAVTAEGNILLYGSRESYLYKPDGGKMFTMVQDFWGSTDVKNILVNGNEFITILDGAVVRYSLLDGQVKETITYDGLQSGVDGIGTIMFPDGTDGIYVANDAGLAHINKGGTVWENLIDGTLNSMGMRSLNMRAFMAGDNDDYYGFYTDGMGNSLRMYQYTYDPDMAAVPPVTLNVYALKDNSTVRQAAALLQKDNPDVRVELRAALQDDDSSMTEEVIRSLNTELLSGKGADVLILDGLPAESYIEKGVLMDMRDLFDHIQSESPLCTNILEGFTREDGAVYEMPVRVAIPAAMGNAEAIAAFSSMEAMAAYQGELPLISADTYENLLHMIANIQYQELFGSGLEGLSEETLQKYLETVKTLGEKSGSKWEFTEDEMIANMSNNNLVHKGIRGGAINYDAGMADGALEYFDSIFGMNLAMAMAVLDKHPGMEIKSVNSVYFPSSIVGINQATKQRETAEQFVKYLFSTPVQKENFYDGFPVQKEALDDQGAGDREGMSFALSAGDGGYTLSGDYPSQEKREHVLNMISQLTVPVDIDDTIMEMIVSESKDYFENKATSAQAASAISQKIKLYLTE